MTSTLKKVALLQLIILGLFACRPVKKIQTINTAITKKDTAQVVQIKTIPVVDSAMIVKKLLDKIATQKIDFNTLNAKIKVEYSTKDNNQAATAYVSVKKDSIIFIQLKATVLGIIAFQVKISPDSVYVINKLDKWIEKRSISYLKESIGIPFDFATLQDLLLGNPIFLDSNIVSYKNMQNQFLILVHGELFKHLITLNKANNTIMHTKLDDIDPLKIRTCDITYDDYVQTTNGYFSNKRNLTISEKSKLDIQLDFKECIFNEPLRYTFAMPKNYKKK